MSIGPITSISTGQGIPSAALSETAELRPAGTPGTVKKPSDPSEVARQFEAILVRQILSESMKSMLEHGKDGQVYGYYLTEALADGITKGGGLGLRSVLESQLRQQTPAQSGETGAAQATGAPKTSKDQKSMPQVYGGAKKP